VQQYNRFNNLCTLHVYRLLSEEICNEYAAQAMFFQGHTFRTALLQPLRWCCVYCVIHHERNAEEEQKYICVAQASNNKRDCNALSLLLLAAAARSFAHMPLGISDRNNMVCDQDMWSCRVQPSRKEHASVRFVVKRRGFCYNFSGGVALIV